MLYGCTLRQIILWFYFTGFLATNTHSMISLELWNGLPPWYPHLEALIAGFPTIYLSSKFRSAAVLLCADSCRLALPSVHWLYLMIRGADPYRVRRIRKPSIYAFRRYPCLWYSACWSYRHSLNKILLHLGIMWCKIYLVPALSDDTLDE